MAHQQVKEVVLPWVATPIKWKASAAERAVLVMGKGQVAERVKVLAHKVEAAKVAAMAVVPAAAEPVVAAMAALILWRPMKEVVRRPIGMAHQQAKEAVRP